MLSGMSTFTQHCGNTRAHGPHSRKVKNRDMLGRVVSVDTYNCKGTRDRWKPKYR